MIATTDPIADMLTRIRNAMMVQKNQITVPYSKIKESIVRLLADNKFIYKVEINGEGVDKQLLVTINLANTNPNISKIERVSKPGRRHYVNSKNIPTIMRGRGIVIVSTSKGLMTGDDAKNQGIGGEIICKVY